MTAIILFLKSLIPKNIKTYLILAGIILFLALFSTIKILHNSNLKLKSENARIEGNQFALLSDNQNKVNLFLKEKEVTGQLKKERDSLAKELKIKPKQITDIITIDNSTHDTLKVTIPVYITTKNEWLLKDSTRCLKYASKLILKGDSIKAERQYFEYNNKITEVFYKIRPHRFLFIRYGKWQFKEKISSTCGTVQEKDITFTK
jgi:hypothetical protein